MTSPLPRLRASMVASQPLQPRLPAQSNSQAPPDNSSRRRARPTSPPTKHSSLTAIRRPSSPRSISSKAVATTSSIIRPLTSKNSNWSRSGSPTRTSSWRTRGEMRSRTPTSEIGARLGAAWRPKSSAARSTSTKRPTLSKLEDSSEPTGSQRIGIQTMTQPNSNLRLIARIAALTTTRMTSRGIESMI